MIGAVSLKPVQDLGMNALLRAALAGAVIGLLESILWSHGPEDDGTGAMLMLFVPFPLGLLLCRLAVLPLWGVVAGVAPFIIMLLFGACLERLTMPEIMDFGIVQGTLIFMGIGASGYVAATALVMPGRKVLSLSTTGAVLVLYCAVAVLQGSIDEAARAVRIDRSGLPLVAVDGYRPAWVDEWGLPSTLRLTYQHEGDGSNVEVFVRKAKAATPKAACAQPDPESDGRPGACRRVSRDVWARTDGARAIVVTRRGIALVRLVSDSAGEAALVSLVPTLRSITTSELSGVPGSAM